ncbi:MAG TPA: hypothetical protein VLJ61_13790 [Pyrinomonadaceae bacterium]|nr:hypothetical protein [Pyrinomonadaceae bacterium]
MSNALERVIRESKEREERKAAEKAARDAKIKKLADEARATKDAEKEDLKRRQEAFAAEQEGKFEAELEDEAKRLFRAGNPLASEETWESVREEYRKKVLLQRSEETQRRTEAFYRASWS